MSTYSFGFFSPLVLELLLRSLTTFSILNDTGLIQFTHLELGAGGQTYTLFSSLLWLLIFSNVLFLTSVLPLFKCK